MNNVNPQSDTYMRDPQPMSARRKMSVGDILRRTRLHYKQSLEDIERDLRIRAEQLKAIEEGDVSKLPGKVYALGFVRSYAEHLGLDGNKIVALYKRQNSAWAAPKPEMETPANANDTKVPPMWLIVSTIVCALILLAAWFVFLKPRAPKQLVIPTVPQAESIQQGTLAPPQFTESQVESDEIQTKTIVRPASKAPEGIVMHVKANSWVQIEDASADKVLVSRVLKAGEKYYVPNRENLMVSVGNAGGLEIKIDDQVLGNLGENGEVIQNLPLSVSSMFEMFPDADTLVSRQAPPMQDAPLVTNPIETDTVIKKQ